MCVMCGGFLLVFFSFLFPFPPTPVCMLAASVLFTLTGKCFSWKTCILIRTDESLNLVSCLQGTVKRKQVFGRMKGKITKTDSPGSECVSESRGEMAVNSCSSWKKCVHIVAWPSLIKPPPP